MFWHQLLYCLALRSQKNQCNDKNDTIWNYYECQLPKSSHSCGWVEYDLSPIYSIHEPVRWVMSAITYVDTYLTCKVYAVLKVRTNDQFKIQSNFRKKLWYFDTPYSQGYLVGVSGGLGCFILLQLVKSITLVSLFVGVKS